jgi:hypothetical protein
LRIPFPSLTGRAQFFNLKLAERPNDGPKWALFADPAPLRAIKFLTMEYHLWAKPGARLSDLEAALDRLRFQVTDHTPSPKGTFGMLFAQQLRGL